MVRGTAADSATPLVVFSHVRKTYDGRHLVVKDLNLEIRRGEFLTLLGPSGSGKTTSLMMLAGFEVPTEGEITLDGRPIKHLPPHRRDLGVVFQNYALFPHMTVAENVAFPLTVRHIGQPEITHRVRRALAMVQLGGFEERRPAQLSGGQQQRVALARALVFEPQLVLMDEPLGALDKKLREHMQIELKHLHQRLGLTFVYVTHDQGEALTMSDRVAVFNDGQIQQIDTPSVLYEAPRNSFVAQFIGENNILHGTVSAIHTSDDGRGALCTVQLDGGAGEVVARAVNVAGVGARTSLSFRPERVNLDDDDQPAPDAAPDAALQPDPAGSGARPGLNRLPAVVRETIYFGDHLRLRLAVAGNESFMVKRRFRARQAPPAPGEQRLVSFSADDCVALDPVAEAPPDQL